MEYRWRCADEHGRDVPSVDGHSFADQGDAEDWLSEHWRELADAGVDRVTLLHGEAEVYGPMSMHPAD
ncbi:MAG: hypothetical protein J2O49_10590 [Sciscionella sp.]|nr:hypothetical protein [Sciscionella sp.]